MRSCWPRSPTRPPCSPGGTSAPEPRPDRDRRPRGRAGRPTSTWRPGSSPRHFSPWRPGRGRGPAPRAILPALLFVAGFGVAVAPIFLLKEGRQGAYFARPTDHSIVAEMRFARSVMPVFAAAADSLVAPWFLEDPYRHHDLPDRSKLGWIPGPPVALILARSLVRPREPLSAYLLTQGGRPGGLRRGRTCRAFRWLPVRLHGRRGRGRGCRGVLCAMSGSPTLRRTAGVAALGLLTIVGAAGARDALANWPLRRETFDHFHGQDTLLARAALR
jgi:hypothetical protein